MFALALDPERGEQREVNRERGSEMFLIFFHFCFIEKEKKNNLRGSGFLGFFRKRGNNPLQFTLHTLLMYNRRLNKNMPENLRPPCSMRVDAFLHAFHTPYPSPLESFVILLDINPFSFGREEPSEQHPLPVPIRLRLSPCGLSAER